VAIAATFGGYFDRLVDGLRKSIKTMANLPNCNIREAGIDKSKGRGRKYTLSAAVMA
jgi:hypothetical protein